MSGAQQGLSKELDGTVEIPALNVEYDDALLPHLGANDVQDAIDKLKAATPTGKTGSFQKAIGMADGSDFTVSLPASLVQLTTNYNVIPTIGAANTFTGVSFSFADNTLTTFRITTDAPLPVGTVMTYQIQPLS